MSTNQRQTSRKPAIKFPHLRKKMQQVKKDKTRIKREKKK